MSKVVTNPISAFTQGAIATLNQNFDRIQAAMENTLSRDGTIPNQMTADLDMNKNDILNVENIDVKTLSIDGNPLDLEGAIEDMEDLLGQSLDAATRAEQAATRAEQAASSVDAPDEDDLTLYGDSLAIRKNVQENLIRKERKSFNTVVDFESDTTLNNVGGIDGVEPGDFISAQGYRYEVVADDESEFSVENLLGVRVIQRNDYVTPAMFGMINGSSSAQHERMAKAMKAAIEDAIPLVVRGEYVLDVMDLSGVTAGGDLRIELAGKLNHVDSSSGDMFNFGTRDSVKIIGGILDGQFAEQSSKRLLMPVAQTKRFHISGVQFLNVSKGAIHQQNPMCESFIVEKCRFLEGALHTGVTGGGTDMVLVRAGKYWRVSESKFIQTADPALNENRNPTAVVYINTGSGEPSKHGVVANNYIENMGYSSAGNHLGCIDAYSRCDKLDILSNVIRKARLFGIRTNYANGIHIAGNDVEVPSQMYLNDTTIYTDAAAIAVGLVDRSYASDNGNLREVTVCRNRVAVSGNHNCYGVSVVNSDTDHLIEMATVEKNNISSTGTNTYYGLFAVAVADLVDTDNDITGFGRQRVVQGGSPGTVTAGLAKIKHRLRGGTSHGGTFALFARTNATNLDVSVDNHHVDGCTNAFSLRDLGDVRIAGGNMGGAIMDAQGNDSFTMSDVKGDGGSFPNLVSNDTFDVSGGASISDRASWGFRGGVTTIATDADATLTPGTTGETVRHTGTMTADRALTLSTTKAKAGKTRFRVVRTGSGAFNLSVGGLKNLATNQWCEVEFNGTAYVLIAFGSL